MKPVRVRFACKPDAVVRRRVISEGEILPAGQVKSFTFRGYLCKLVAERTICIADVIDLPIRLLGFRGPAWRAGSVCPAGYTVAGKREDYAPDKVGELDLSAKFIAKYFVAAGYGASEGQAAIGSVMPPVVEDRVIVRASMQVVYDGSPSGAGHDPFFSGCDPQRFQLVVALLAGRRLMAVIDDAWLQSTLGADYTLATAYGSVTPEPLAPSPVPAAFGQEFYRPRSQVPQPRQIAMPGVAWGEVEDVHRVVVAVQVASEMPENNFTLNNSYDDPPRWGTLQFPYARAALPALAIIELVPTPVPFTEDGEVDEEQLPPGVDLGFLMLDGVPEWAVPSNPPPATGARFLNAADPLLVPADDWPEHLRPVEFVPELILGIAGDPGMGAVGFNAPAFPDLSGRTSYRPCVVGAIHSTNIDGVVEFVAAVRAVDEHRMPITEDLRSGDVLGIGPDDVAKVKVTRTGLLVVRYDMATGTVTTRALAPDVVGSDQCPWFDGSSMDADIAYCPQVLWGGVIGGKRCYAVRALRYERTLFLGTFLQHINLNLRRTTNYQGEFPVAGYPGFLTDRGFGPYIDREQPEELWWVVDDVISRVALPEGYLAAVRPRVSTPAIAGQTSLSQYMALVYASMNILSAPGSEKWQQYAMEEYLPPNTALQQFAQISKDRVVYFLPAEDDRNGTLIMQVFDGETVAQYATVSTPWVNGVHYTDSRHSDPVYALTCYQQEVWVEGELSSPACLILTVTSGPRGYSLLTRDGGVTWEPLVSAPDDFEEGRSLGIPGHGYIFSGSAIWSPKPGYPYVKESSNG